MTRKLIGVLAALLCVSALPWSVRTDNVAAISRISPAAAAASEVASADAVNDAALDNAAAPVADSSTGARRVRVAPAGDIAADVLNLALDAVQCAATRGDIEPPPTLTVIDYSRPSVEPRLWVFDLDSGDLLFRELVAHGRNTGENTSVHFSDRMNSRQSSLGLFVTADPYVGSNGYSLRLDGLEPGFNGRARDRAIVIHGAPYVNAAFAAAQGRLGRSWGCPALREAVARDVIDTIRGGGVIFSYYPDSDWLQKSTFLNGCSAAA